jgi:hypothetical protein
MDNGRSASLVPWATMVNAFYVNTPEERHMKMATLLFDDVYLPITAKHLLGVGTEFARQQNLKVEQITSVWHSVESVHPDLVAAKIAMTPFEPPTDLVFGKDGNWRRGLRGVIKAEVAKTLGVSEREVRKMEKSGEYVQRYAVAREGNALALTAVGSVVAWTMIRAYLNCTYLPMNEVEFAAANLILRENNSDALRAANLLLPDAGDLSWQEVFEVRERSEANSFRRWLNSRSWSKGGSRTLEQDIVGALAEALNECRPNVGNEILKGIASNIPIPLPINPLSLCASLRSVASAQRFQENYDWCCFLVQRKAGWRS